MAFSNPVPVQSYNLSSTVQTYFTGGELSFLSLEGKGNQLIADVSNKKYGSQPSQNVDADIQGAGTKACFIYSDGKQNQTGFEFVSSKEFFNQLDNSMKLTVAQPPKAAQKTTYGKTGMNVQIVNT